MTKLSVNINKIATIRNARGGNNPDVVSVALDCERFGAQGITVHPRPDERHIRRADVYALKPILSTEFNIEGYPSSDFIEMVLEVKPAQVTLVPDPPGVLTSNAGWNCIEKGDFLRPILAQFKQAGIRTSVFLEPDPQQVSAALDTGTDRIELYTESFATLFEQGKAEEAVAPYRLAGEKALELGLGLNAGHDLSLHNLRYFRQQVPGLLEVSIGHALICDALYFGLENTIRMYRERLERDV